MQTSTINSTRQDRKVVVYASMWLQAWSLRLTRMCSLPAGYHQPITAWRRDKGLRCQGFTTYGHLGKDDNKRQVGIMESYTKLLTSPITYSRKSKDVLWNILGLRWRLYIQSDRGLSGTDVTPITCSTLNLPVPQEKSIRRWHCRSARGDTDWDIREMYRVIVSLIFLVVLADLEFFGSRDKSYIRSAETPATLDGSRFTFLHILPN